MVKNPLAMQETWVQSLGQEDPLEKEWLSTLLFLPGEFCGERSLACLYSYDLEQFLKSTQGNKARICRICKYRT